MRREERVTVQGPVKEQQPDGMSHRGGGGGGGVGRGCPSLQTSPQPFGSLSNSLVQRHNTLSPRHGTIRGAQLFSRCTWDQRRPNVQTAAPPPPSLLPTKCPMTAVWGSHTSHPDAQCGLLLSILRSACGVEEWPLGHLWQIHVGIAHHSTAMVRSVATSHTKVPQPHSPASPASRQEGWRTTAA